MPFGVSMCCLGVPMSKQGYENCPYSDFEPFRLWKSPEEAGNILEQPGRLGVISKKDIISSAGSCFAQNIARYLLSNGFSYQFMENAPEFFSEKQVQDWGYRQFSCRYGNIYSIIQLQQLLERSLGKRQVKEQFWCNNQGRWFDLLRPRINRYGFDSETQAVNDCHKHLEAVLNMVRHSTVFVFTYGLIEYWFDERDGTVFPSVPGCGIGDFNANYHKPGLLNIQDNVEATKKVVSMLRELNPNLKIIVTVSPVPLLATHRGMNIVEASVHSKSVLRASIEECKSLFENFYYFPSYEIVMQYCANPVWDPSGRNPSQQTLDVVFQNFEYQLVAEFDSNFLEPNPSSTPSSVQNNTSTADTSSQPEQSKSSTTTHNSKRNDPNILCDEEEIFLALAKSNNQN